MKFRLAVAALLVAAVAFPPLVFSASPEREVASPTTPQAAEDCTAGPGGSGASSLRGLLLASADGARATTRLYRPDLRGLTQAGDKGARSSEEKPAIEVSECRVTMDGARAITATFRALPAYALTVVTTGTGGGTVVSEPAGINCGTTCTANVAAGTMVRLTAAAEVGSEFSGWTGACAGASLVCELTMDGAKAVTATFRALPTYALTVVTTGTGGGTVVSETPGINCGTTCRANIAAGATVRLTATAQLDSVFSGWTGACTGLLPTCTVTMDAAKAVTATFTALPTFALTVVTTGTGGGTVVSEPPGINCGTTCRANVAAGTTVRLTATAQAGSEFAGWSGPCQLVSTRLTNLSTRGQVQTGDNVMIGGFIISGSAPKKVLVTARGPSLTAFGVAGAMDNPSLQLVSGQTVIASNDDWGSASNASEIQATGKAPANALESAILTTLNPGAYTAIVSGVNGGTGVGIVEVFEIDRPDAPLANLSTRGQVQTGDNVMIGGFVIEGTQPRTVLIRANGPSLTAFGVQGALANPTLTLNSGQTVIATNDDWGTASNAAAIQATGLAPTSPLEAAILITLNPGAYTAVVSGANGGSGVGIVEVYAQ